METPYRAVSFSKHDIITRQDMDQLEFNYRYVNDNTPRGLFHKAETKKIETYLIVVSGRATIKKKPKVDTSTVKVKFGKAFHPNCHPSITTGIVSRQTKVFCVVHGPKKIDYPNATGFEMTVNIADSGKKDKIKNNFFVNWQAMGYRTEDMYDF